MTLNEIQTELKINVTEMAASNILSLIAEKQLGDCYVRLFVEQVGCSGSRYGMALSPEPEETDTIVHSNGVRILLDPFSVMCLDGATIDYVETPSGPDFTINNPNEVQEIGSGCSSCSAGCK